MPVARFRIVHDLLHVLQQVDLQYYVASYCETGGFYCLPDLEVSKQHVVPDFLKSSPFGEMGLEGDYDSNNLSISGCVYYYALRIMPSGQVISDYVPPEKFAKAPLYTRMVRSNLWRQLAFPPRELLKCS